MDSRWTNNVCFPRGQPPLLPLTCSFARSPNGIRTRVFTLRGWCPRPLDDGAKRGQFRPGPERDSHRPKPRFGQRLDREQTRVVGRRNAQAPLSEATRLRLVTLFQREGHRQARCPPYASQSGNSVDQLGEP